MAATSARSESLLLAPRSVVPFAGDVGATIERACEVLVLRRRGQAVVPVRGVAVRFEVLRGPLTLRTRRTLTVRTDRSGRAAIDARFRGRGAAVVTATLASGGNGIVDFRGTSDGMAHSLEIAECLAVAAQNGRIVLRVFARDHHGHPVERARLRMEAILKGTIGVRGTVRELGAGIYEARFRTHAAGRWHVVVQDRRTHAFGATSVTVTPARPAAVAIVSVSDPRSKPPYTRATLVARLQDRFGNTLDPARLRATVGTRRLARQVDATNATFTIDRRDPGEVRVSVKDSRSSVACREVVSFAPATLDMPGLIAVGSSFRSVLRLFPPNDRPLQRARVTVSFPARRARFVGFEGMAPLGPRAQLIGRGRIRVDVQGEGRVPANVTLGTFDWKCLGAGETCFRVTTRMSPPSSWYSCPSQKRHDPKTLCINFLYPGSSDTAAERVANAQKMAQQIVAILSSEENVEACCPALTLNTHMTPLSNAEMRKIIEKLGSSKLKNPIQDSQTVVNLGLAGTRPHCFNIFMLEFDDDSGAGGWTSTGSYPRQTVIDWRVDPAAAAHECAHALGLDDLYKYKIEDGQLVVTDPGPAGNLMSGTPGKTLTREQCKTIWDHLDAYGG